MLLRLNWFYLITWYKTLFMTLVPKEKTSNDINLVYIIRLNKGLLLFVRIEVHDFHGLVSAPGRNRQREVSDNNRIAMDDWSAMCLVQRQGLPLAWLVARIWVRSALSLSMIRLRTSCHPKPCCPFLFNFLVEPFFMDVGREMRRRLWSSCNWIPASSLDAGIFCENNKEMEGHFLFHSEQCIALLVT